MNLVTICVLPVAVIPSSHVTPYKELVMVFVAVTAKVRLNHSVGPRLGTIQVTTSAANVPPSLAAMKVAPMGSASVMTREEADTGALLVITSV